jgi:hypothetical protein
VERTCHYKTLERPEIRIKPLSISQNHEIHFASKEEQISSSTTNRSSHYGAI